ncbi:MAG: hypothetical protein LKG21_02615 [Ruminococcus sp.]|jgi:hypothetical protein|nr:hypothetical protein [Ruminococcus sp.]
MKKNDRFNFNIKDETSLHRKAGVYLNSPKKYAKYTNHIDEKKQHYLWNRQDWNDYAKSKIEDNCLLYDKETSQYNEKYL